MKRSLWTIFALGVAISMILVACAQPIPQVEERVVVVTPTLRPETTIWFGSGSTLLDPYLVPIFTLGRDRLADRGIILEYVTLSTDEAVEAALDRDRVDVALLSTVGLNRAVSQGLKMKFVVGIEMQNTFVLTTRADVTDLEQLRGKKVGTQSRTSLSVAVAEVMLREQAGLEPGEDYEMVYLPGSDNRAAAMEAGSLDAAVLFRNVAAQLEERSNGEFKIYGGLWDVLDPMLWEGLAMSERFRANKELATTFVKAMLETYEEFYAGDPAEMAPMKEGIPEAEPLDEGALVGDYELFKRVGLYPQDGGLDPAYYNAMTDFLVAVGQLEPDQVVPYEDAVDPSILEAALAGQ
ncbi:MAG: ABC transporter substrate-binding protein [Anaerolineae bacterium]